MGQQLINIGAAADDGTGDKLRTAGAKINANFAELYGKLPALAAYVTEAQAAETGAQNANAGAQAALLAILAQLAGVPLASLTLNAADRATLAALDTTTGLPARLGSDGGIFYAVDKAPYAAHIAADSGPQAGIYVVSTFDPSKVWIRNFDTPANPLWWGHVGGDNSANGPTNNAAHTAMLNTLIARGKGAAKNGIESILWPADVYWFSSSVILHGGMLNYRMSAGSYVGSADNGAVFKFPAGVTGVKIPDTADSPSGVSATGSTIEGIVLRGGFVSGNAEAEAHGFQPWVPVKMKSCRATHFEGDGFNGQGQSPGSLDRCHLQNCVFDYNRNGFFCDGSDANVITTINCAANANRQWGFWDSGFLGNVHIDAKTAANGFVSDNDGVIIGVSQVSYSGNRYYVRYGQAAGASANAPSGTTADNTWWAYLSAGGATTGIPLWANGILCREGGAFHADQPASPNTWVGCYSEGGQAGSTFSDNNLVLNGDHAAPVRHTDGGTLPGYIRCSTKVLVLGGRNTIVSGSLIVDPQTTGNAPVLGIKHPTYATNGYNWQYTNNGNLSFAYGTAGADTSANAMMLLTTAFQTAQKFGRSAAVSGALYIPTLMVGSSVANARQVTNGTAAPTAGTWARGDRVLNMNAAVGSPLGWVCTVAGTPGTWVAMANL